MKKNLFFLLTFALLCNPAVLLAQTEPEEVKSETDKFEDFFYESLKQKGIENYDKAVAALGECLKIRPNEAAIYSELGKSYLASKDYEHAYNSFEKATQIDPKNKWFWLGMYDVNYQTKNYKQALITVNKLIEFDEIYKEDLVSLYMNTQQFDKALALINELNDKTGKSERRELYKIQILSQGKYQDAEITNLIEQIDKNPKEESNYIALIRLYSENNSIDKAVETTKKLEKEIPSSEWAQVSLFKYYIDTNEGLKAVKAMNIVLASNKIDPKIQYRVLNEFLIFANTNPQYEADLEKAIASFDNKPEVNVAKEVGKYYHNKKQWDKAIHYYELALKNNSVEDIETDLLLLESYLENNQFELVVKKSSEMIEKFPTQPQFYYSSGLANNQLKQFKKAATMLEMGLDYVFDNAPLEINFNIQLGEAYSGLGNSKKKEFYFSKADQLLKTKKEN